MGAVATTFMAGVEAVRRRLALPIGSLTHMGTIRLGKRTDNRSPAIHEFVPLARLDDLVFAGWDLFTDNAYEAALKAGVLEPTLLAQIKDFLAGIRPMPAVFEQKFVKNLLGGNVKTGKTKMDLAEQITADIQEFRKRSALDRLVMIWCGSTETFLKPSATHRTLAAFEKALTTNSPEIAPSMIYA
jgi:myo-inositol-1-phosphate synthase